MYTSYENKRSYEGYTLQRIESLQDLKDITLFLESALGKEIDCEVAQKGIVVRTSDGKIISFLAVELFDNVDKDITGYNGLLRYALFRYDIQDTIIANQFELFKMMCKLYDVETLFSLCERGRAGGKHREVFFQLGMKLSTLDKFTTDKDILANFRDKDVYALKI